MNLETCVSVVAGHHLFEDAVVSPGIESVVSRMLNRQPLDVPPIEPLVDNLSHGCCLNKAVLKNLRSVSLRDTPGD